MDPMLFSQAHKLHAEMLAENTQYHKPQPRHRKNLLYHLGSLLLILGEKMQGRMPQTPPAFNRPGFTPLEDEICV